MSEEEHSLPKEPEANKPSGLSHSTGSGLAAFWKELKRRKVMRVAITYAVVAWLIMQVAGLTFEGFGVPIWAFRFVVIVLWLFFPVAIILTWAFELTPEGIKTTKNARESQGEEPVSKTHLRKRNWMALGFAAALPTMVFGALAVYFYATRDSVDDVVEKSIAVLPLESMSSDPSHAYFADAIHDEILTNLANISDLVVIGRTSVRQYEDTVKTLEQIGKELSVRYLVEGSVFRDQNQASINIQLIDTETRGHIWANVYDRNLDDLFSIRSAVAKDVAEQLHAVLSPEEAAELNAFPTTNREAYDSFLKSKEANRRERIQLLLEVTRLDPDFYEAWLSLGLSSVYGYSGWGKSEPELLAHAQNAIQQAERLKPEHIKTFGLLSMYEQQINHDLEAALKILKRRKIVHGGYSRELGRLYKQLGQLENALVELEGSWRENPSQGVIRLYITYVHLKKWDEGRVLLEEKLERLQLLTEEYGEEDYRQSQLGYKRSLVQHVFLQEGGLSQLVSSIMKVPETSEDPWRQLWKALIERDYPSVRNKLNLVGSDPPGSESAFSSGRVAMHLIIGNEFNLEIEPMNLLSALVHFQQGERESMLEESARARAYWEEIIASSQTDNPDYLSHLAICYALEGEREKMEAVIPEIRELTATRDFQFLKQAECEAKLAIAYIVLGEEDKALDILENAVKLHSQVFIKRELDLWFIFDRLRGDPRFDALLDG